MCATIYVNPVNACQCCSMDFDAGGPMYDAYVPLWKCWGNVCEDCFNTHGCSLGTGNGQKYELQDLPGEVADNVKRAWVKTAG